MRLSNAPCSWGIFYPDAPRVPPERYLDEVAQTGYAGTELGPYGFLPTDSAALNDALAARDLVLEGAVHVHTLSRPESADTFYADIDAIARLLKSAGAAHLVVMDEGNVYPDDAIGVLTSEQWRGLTAMLEEGRKRVEGEHGLTVSFHPHVATAVEHEHQIDRLLGDTAIALCFDTGHHAFWDQDPLAYMDKVWDRIAYMHLKNVDARVRQRVLDGALGVRESFDAGVMCPLPDGVVDIPAVIERLRDRAFTGPVVVEQDFFESSPEPPEVLALRNAQFLEPLISSSTDSSR